MQQDEGPVANAPLHVGNGAGEIGSAKIGSAKRGGVLAVILAIPVAVFFWFAAYSPAHLALPEYSDRMEQRPSFASTVPVAQVISDKVV